MKHLKRAINRLEGQLEYWQKRMEDHNKFGGDDVEYFHIRENLDECVYALEDAKQQWREAKKC